MTPTARTSEASVDSPTEPVRTHAAWPGLSLPLTFTSSGLAG